MKSISGFLAVSALAGTVAHCAPVASANSTATATQSTSSPHAVVGWQTAPNRTVPYVPITYPKYGEVWLGATHHNVTWDTDHVPANQTFTNTAVFIAQNGHVISSEPLASNFSLLDGRVVVETPKDKSGGGFQAILYAAHGSHEDRGSYSPEYSIVNLDVPN